MYFHRIYLTTKIFLLKDEDEDEDEGDKDEIETDGLQSDMYLAFSMVLVEQLLQQCGGKISVLIEVSGRSKYDVHCCGRVTWNEDIKER